MAKNKDGGGGGGERAVSGGSGGQQPVNLAHPARAVSSGRGLRERHRGAGRERVTERLGRPGREAYPHLIQLTGAIWQLLAR